MSYAVITTKIDPKDKKEAQQIAEELGLSLSAVIKAMLKHFIRLKRLEVGIRPEIPNARTLKVLKKAEENYKKGNTSPAFKNIEDELKWLEDQGI